MTPSLPVSGPLVIKTARPTWTNDLKTMTLTIELTPHAERVEIGTTTQHRKQSHVRVCDVCCISNKPSNLIRFDLFSAMPTRLSNTRKLRGHVSHGHGRVGKHRKHPGGRGLAGGQHHHRTNFDKCTFPPKYDANSDRPSWVLRKSWDALFPWEEGNQRLMTSAYSQVWKSSVNLDKLWTLVPEEIREKFLNKGNDTVPVIDTLALVWMGIF